MTSLLLLSTLATADASTTLYGELTSLLAISSVSLNVERRPAPWFAVSGGASVGYIASVGAPDLTAGLRGQLHFMTPNERAVELALGGGPFIDTGGNAVPFFPSVFVGYRRTTPDRLLRLGFTVNLPNLGPTVSIGRSL